MRNSQLFQLLSSFDRTEWRDFQKWIRSPFFNSREDVLRLSEYIESHWGRRPGALKKEAAWAVLFPDKGYDDKQMNYLISWIFQQVKDFLAYREWSGEGTTALLYLSRALRKKNLPDLYEKNTNYALKKLEQQPYRDENYHFTCYQLLQEKYEYQQLLSRKGDIPIQDIAAHSEAAAAFSRLRLACYREIIAGIKPDHPSAVAEITLSESTGIRLYTNLLNAFRDTASETSFYEARSLLKVSGGTLRDGELRQLYLMALNYCIRKINSGRSEFMREAFELYRNGLESRVLFENGVLSRFTYHNAVTSALYEHEFEWAREFIETYKVFLPPKDRHQAYQFNLATYYFRLPDYDAAMDLLRDAEFDFDSLANLSSRSMLLRIYFEKGYQDALLSLLDSFQAYLRRHPEIGYQQENYSNLLRFVRRMSRDTPLTTAEKTGLIREIENTKALAERRWLLEKLGV